MRKHLRKLMVLGLSLAILVGTPITARATESKNYILSSWGCKSDIAIDGVFSDWDKHPCSYEYNWDNSNQCWNDGVWIGDRFHKTPPGTFDTVVRHKIQFYFDGEYVYLHIVYAKIYDSKLNGDNFEFWVDDQRTTFRILTEDGLTLGKDSVEREPGVYALQIQHGESGLSYTPAEGASGCLKVTDHKFNNAIEIRIPLEELQRQNPAINIETISKIKFFAPNLMYRPIIAVGTSSGPILLAFLCAGVVLCSWIVYKRKNHGNLQV